MFFSKKYGLIFLSFFSLMHFPMNAGEFKSASIEFASTSETERLQSLFNLYWEYTLRECPEMATYVGDRRYNHQWTDCSLEAIQQRELKIQEFLETLKLINPSSLNEADRLSYDVFLRNLEENIEGFQFKSEYMPCNQFQGLHLEINQILMLMPTETVQDFESMVARLNAVPELIDQNIVLMNEGLKNGIVPPKIVLRAVPDQILNQIQNPAAESLFFQPFTQFSESISLKDQHRLTLAATEAIEKRVYPAFEKLYAYLIETYIPKCLDEVGMSALPNGRAWYAYLVRHSTTTKLMPRQIHEIGLAEVKRIKEEMLDTMKRIGFKGTRTEFMEFLNNDPQFFYDQSQDLLQGYREITAFIETQLPKLFGKLPQLPYEIVQVPAYSEQSSSGAYYCGGSLKTGRPGRFFVNTYNLKTRPKWEMECLTLHEAIPGHHMQVSLALELDNLPEFRKYHPYTAYIEGWGLYSESLGTELGLYKDPYSKFGRLINEMMRAVRLVVDTGLHDLGWSRQQAIDYFIANVGSDEHEAIVEVDRYLVIPAQALAYKIGELKIQEWRATAAQSLGSDFDIRAFHDELLGDGALPLDVCEAKMQRWIERKCCPIKYYSFLEFPGGE
jgi:uncharacterized protein (DUF885 family)